MHWAGPVSDALDREMLGHASASCSLFCSNGQSELLGLFGFPTPGLEGADAPY